MLLRHFGSKFVSGILLLVCISAIMLRVPGIFTPVWSLDEAVSACVANAIVDGGIPYQDAIDHRGPATYYAYALMFLLFGANNMVAVHIGLLVLILFVGWWLYGCGAMMADRTTGLLAAGVFFLLSFGLFGAKDLLAAHTEYGVILFSTSGGYAFLRHQSLSERQRRLLKQHWLLWVSGLCYGLAFFSKQPALLDFCAVLGCVGLLTIFKKIPLRNAARQCGFLVAGFLCAVVGIAGFFFMRGGLRDFVFYFWTYNTEFYVTHLSVLERLGINTSFFQYLFTYFPVFGLGLVMGGSYSLYGFWRTRRQLEFQQHEAQLFAVLWAIGALSARSFPDEFRRLGIIISRLCRLSVCSTLWR